MNEFLLLLCIGLLGGISIVIIFNILEKIERGLGGEKMSEMNIELKKYNEMEKYNKMRTYFIKEVSRMVEMLNKQKEKMEKLE